MPTVAEVDAFDLPGWVGEQHVTWAASTSLDGAALVAGELVSGDQRLPCAVLAGDLAYPRSLIDEGWRHDAHQQWTHGQVLLVSYDDRLTLVVPGSQVDAEVTLEAVRRLAKAVGAPAARFTVALRL